MDIKISSCVLCGKPAPYTCPGCARKTCSATCVKAHKEKFQCNGRKVPVEEKKMDEMNEGTLLQDIKFLDTVSETMEREQRNFKAESENLRTPGKALSRTQLKKKRKLEVLGVEHFHTPCAARRTKMVLCPNRNLAIARHNTSYYEKVSDKIYWKLEWQFYGEDAKKEVFHDDAICETVPVKELLERFLQSGGTGEETLVGCSEPCLVSCSEVSSSPGGPIVSESVVGLVSGIKSSPESVFPADKATEDPIEGDNQSGGADQKISNAIESYTSDDQKGTNNEIQIDEAVNISITNTENAISPSIKIEANICENDIQGEIIEDTDIDMQQEITDIQNPAEQDSTPNNPTQPYDSPMTDNNPSSPKFRLPPPKDIPTSPPQCDISSGAEGVKKRVAEDTAVDQTANIAEGVKKRIAEDTAVDQTADDFFKPFNLENLKVFIHNKFPVGTDQKFGQNCLVTVDVSRSIRESLSGREIAEFPRFLVTTEDLIDQWPIFAQHIKDVDFQNGFRVGDVIEALIDMKYRLPPAANDSSEEEDMAEGENTANQRVEIENLLEEDLMSLELHEVRVGMQGKVSAVDAEQLWVDWGDEFPSLVAVFYENVKRVKIAEQSADSQFVVNKNLNKNTKNGKGKDGKGGKKGKGKKGKKGDPNATPLGDGSETSVPETGIHTNTKGKGKFSKGTPFHTKDNKGKENTKGSYSKDEKGKKGGHWKGKKSESTGKGSWSW